MPRERTYTNADGLILGYGTHTPDNAVPAVAAERGVRKTMEMLITGTELELTTATAASLHPQGAIIKRGSLIKNATFTPTVAFTSGGAATLTIGTYKVGTIGTVDVAAGITSATAITAIDAIGETVVCAGTLVNGTIAVGATSDSDVEIVAIAGTAAFTAGKGILVIEYIEPNFAAVAN